MGHLRFKDFRTILRILSTEDYPPVTLAGLTVYDLRPDRHLDHDQVKATFEEAIAYIADGGPAFLDLVQANIAQINVYDVPGETLAWWSRHLNTPLPVRVRRNTCYLACRLVWAGAYFSAFRAVPLFARFFAKPAARKAADQAWLAFVRQFPDSDLWEEYLRSHRIPD